MLGKRFLDDNEISSIEEGALDSCKSLETFDLSHNKLEDTPELFLQNLAELKTIDLSKNNLSLLHEDAFATTTAYTVDLCCNQLQDLSDEIFSSTHALVSVDMCSNKLTMLPEDLFLKNINIQIMYLKRNKLQQVDEDLFKFNLNITTLQLDRNRLTHVPEILFESTLNLESIDVSNNRIEEIPSDLFSSTGKLSSLDFSLNKIGILSKTTVNGLTTVSSLSAAGNEIKNVSADIFSEVCLSNKLDISQNQLRAIPDGLFMSSKVTHQLRILFLQRNSIEYISLKAFAGLYFVQYILLYSNKIHTLSDGAFLDTSVKAVYLFGNSLSEIVGNPFDNRNITELHLYGNKIKTLSEETIFGLQTNTTDIYMDCGELSTTPWAPKHVNIKCVSPAFVPTINISLASVPTALRSQGFNCTINKRSFSQCEPCRPGTFGDGTIGCYPCPAGGFYQDAIGQAASVRKGMACKDCNIGTFVKDEGAISIRECLVCPEGTNQTTKAGFRACYCKENYTRTHRFGPCELCTEKGVNCVSQEYQSLLPGFYWNWTFEKANLTQYAQFAENLQEKSRFYNDHVNYSGQIPKVFKCERPANCLNNGNTTLQIIEGTCETGYRGWMCSKCKPGYYSVLNSCISCPGRVWMLIEPIAVIALCVLFYLVILWQYQHDKNETKNERSMMDVIVSRLKIVLGFYQVIGEFFTSLHDVNWTGILQVIGEAISTVELTVLRVLVRPQCYNSRLEINPKIEFIIGISLPFLIFIGAMSFFQAKRCYLLYKRRKGTQINTEPHLNKVKEKLFTLVLVLLFVSYPPICSVTFQLYPRACKTFCLDHNDEVCIKRLRSDYDIDCEELYLYHWLAYIATALYVVPLPIILLILLRKHCYIKHHAGVHTDGVMETVYESSSSENSPLLQRGTSERPTRTIPVWLLFLCENYKPQFWYWEIIELSRKVSQTLLITLLGWEHKLTVLITIGTSVLFLTMQARFWPMKDLFDQRLQMFSLTAIFINVLVAAMQVPESYEGTISIILVLLNIVVILIIAAPEACGKHGVCNCTKGHSGMDVDCKNINLKEVPTDIPLNTTVLDISHNKLEYLPQGISAATSLLDIINLSFNNLSSIPNDTFASTSDVQFLDLSYNKLQSIPAEAFLSTYHLAAIRASINHLETIPDNLFSSAAELYFVDFSSNNLSVLPDGLFSRNSKINNIQFDQNNLQEIPVDLFAAGKNLRTITVKRNAITTFPVDLFCRNPYLSHMRLSLNEIEEIPAGLFRKSYHLNNLDLSNNKIREISELWFNNTYNLRYVDLSSNNLYSIPANLFASTHELVSLTLSNNMLTELPDMLLRYTPKLKRLFLSKNHISELPGKLFAFTPQLTALYLSNNSIKTIPDPIFSKTPLLKDIDLFNNRISELAIDIFSSCPNLRFVDFSLNHVKKISRETFRGIKNVSTLSVSRNAIETIPMDIFSEILLSDKLDLSSNLLRTIPQGLFLARNASQELTILFLQKNMIEFIPRNAFAGLYRIKHLLLYSNSIHTLSDGAFSGTSAKAIYLFGNNLTAIIGNPFANENISEVYLACGDLTEVPWARKHLNIKCVSPAFVPTLKLPRNLLPRALRQQGFNCTINRKGSSECEPCRPGTFGDGISGCHSCPPVVLWQYKREKKERLIGRSVMDVIVSRLKIVLGFYQVVGGFFASMHGVNWTGALQLIGEAITYVELTILRIVVRPQCYDSQLEINPKLEFIIGVSLPLFITTIAVMYFYANVLVNGNIHQRPGSGNGRSRVLRWSNKHHTSTVKRCRNRHHGRDLSYNGLQDLPAVLFHKSERLSSIDISNNQLEYLPEGIFAATSLVEIINLSYNNLSSIPNDTFASTVNVQSLRLDANMLRDLPETLFSSSFKLKYIDFSSNNLSVLPDGLFSRNSKINTIKFHQNNLEEIPVGLFAAGEHLHTVDLSSNNLYSIPANLFASTRELVSLTLSNNKLTELPDILLRYTPKLERLFVNNNNIQEIPNQFLFSTPEITHIDFGRNNLSKMAPDLFRKTTKLEFVFLSINHISELPRKLFAFTPQLTSLHLANNSIKTIPDDTFSKTPLLKEIQLHGNLIKEIPDNLFYSTPHLYYLDFSLNQVKKISKETFRGIKNVSTLCVSRNAIELISGDIFSEILLSDKLDLSNNRLRTIPQGLFLSRNASQELNILFLQKNRIEFIPRNAFAGLYRIKHFYLFGNNLTDITGNPFANGNISQVHLYNNKIRMVSESAILGLKNGTDMYLACGELTEVPWARKHLSLICVSPAFVPTLKLPRTLLPTALRQQGFNCTINKKGSSKCEPCRPGTFGDGISGCHPCPPGGFYQDAIGQASFFPGGMECKNCNEGTFVKNGSGISIGQCLVCPEGTNQTMKAGFRACRCKQNYTRMDRFGPCELCLDEGLNCTHQEFKSLLPGYYWNWTFPSANIVEYVHFVENLQNESRFYDKAYVNYSGEIPKVHKCQRPDNCPNNGGGNLERVAGTCEDGYRGWLCSKCKTGHYSVLNSCIPCPHKVWLFIEPLGIIGLCVLFCSVVLWQYKREKKERLIGRSVMDVIVSRLKIVLGFYQVVGGFFASMHGVNWTGALQLIGEAITYVELTILRIVVRPQCYDSQLEINPKLEFIIGVSLPIFITTVAAMYFYASKWYFHYMKRKFPDHDSLQSHLFKLKTKVITVVLVLLFITYPPICSTVFQLYPRACKTFCLDRNNKYCMKRLRSDFDIDCEDLTLYNYSAYLATALYVVAFPAFLLFVLRRHTRRIERSHTNELLTAKITSSSVNENTHLMCDTSKRQTLPSWLHFLCENYKPKFWYWEIVELSRKVTQTLLVTLLGWEDKVTVLVTIGTSVLFLTLHARFWPMKDLFDQRLQMFSLTAIFINVLVAAMDVPESYDGAINIILVLLNVVVIVIMAAKAMVSFIRHVKKIKLIEESVRILCSAWLRFRRALRQHR
ncbi:Leucine-rich repeat-containing protein 15 [Holothuria leucospilota]|uniref:Leucine-rich repeat-containing protein 15 n=1 Tax=Holothuria leucospilota TaxID=206669 RepID=A0A9Q1CPD4_HOLLE|nr:Leucine-rich repeat-containing protein 15 [Holothuria leucospilota]